MRLHRIAVEGFRCFGPRRVVGPFDERLTVLHGPNSIGKSSLLLALERVLFDRPDSTDQEISKLAPWDREILPRVELEFSTGEGWFCLSKSFGRQGEARLWKLENGTKNLIREGASAVEWVRELLGGRAPGRGATKPEHHGLGQVLFVVQGNVSMPERLGAGAAERLRGVVGGTLVDRATGAIREAVERRYREFFTEGGRPRKGSDVLRLEEELARAQGEYEEARKAWQQIDDLQEEVVRARDTVVAAERKRDELLAEKQRLGPAVRRYQELVRRRQEAERQRDAAASAFREAAERIDRIRGLRARQRDLEAKLQSAATASAAARQSCIEARRLADEATRRRQEHEEGANGVRATQEEAARAGEFKRLRSDIESLGPKLDRFVALREEVQRLREQLAGLPAVSGREIKQLRDALAEVRSASEALDALRLHVTVRALKKTSVEMDGRTETLEAGRTWTHDADGTVAFRIGNLVEISVAGPATDAAAARDRLQQAEARADKLAAKLGSRVPEDLEERKARRAETERELEIRTAQLAELLEKGAAPEEQAEKAEAALRERLAHARARLAEILRLHPKWDSVPPAVENIERAAREAQREFETEDRRLRREEDAARKEVEVRSAALDQARTAEEQTRVALEGVVGELRVLSGDGLADEERERVRMERSVALQQAEDALRQANEALESFPVDPGTEYERVDRELQALQDGLPAHSAELGRREQALKAALAAAPYARLAKKEEEVAELEGKLRRARLDADATALLHRLFEEEHASTVRLLLQPVADRVLPRLRKLVGPTVEDVSLDEEFRPARVRLRGVNREVEPDDLSFGTRDQLSLLVRIALGEILAEKERLPIVLDDPLAHADASRLRRFLGLLEEAADRLQVIILTCRPMDYRSLAGARFLDLEQLGEPRPDAVERPEPG